MRSESEIVWGILESCCEAAKLKAAPAPMIVVEKPPTRVAAAATPPTLPISTIVLVQWRERGKVTTWTATIVEVDPTPSQAKPYTVQFAKDLSVAKVTRKSICEVICAPVKVAIKGILI